MKVADRGHSLKAVRVKRFLRQHRSSSRDRRQPAGGAWAGLPGRWCMDGNVPPIPLFCCARGWKPCVMRNGGPAIGQSGAGRGQVVSRTTTRFVLAFSRKSPQFYRTVACRCRKTATFIFLFQPDGKRLRDCIFCIRCIAALLHLKRASWDYLPSPLIHHAALIDGLWKAPCPAFQMG